MDRNIGLRWSWALNLSLFIILFNEFVNSNPESSFKCKKDGLFKDTNNCHKYHRCLWTGTVFQRKFQLSCAPSLLYNTLEKRCDKPEVIERQFLNGIHTGTDLLSFMRFKSCLIKGDFKLRSSSQMKANVKSVEQFLEENINILKTRLVYHKTKFWKGIRSKGRMLTGSRLIQKSNEFNENNSTKPLPLNNTSTNSIKIDLHKTQLVSLPINTTNTNKYVEVLNIEGPRTFINFTNEAIAPEAGEAREADLILERLNETTIETNLTLMNETLSMDSINLTNITNEKDITQNVESFKVRKLLAFEEDDFQTTMESKEYDVNDRSYQDRDIAVDQLAKSIQKRSRQQMIESEIQKHLTKKSFMRFGNFANRVDRSSYLKPVLKLASDAKNSVNERLVSLTEYLNGKSRKINLVESATTASNIKKMVSSASPKSKITRVTTKNNLLQTYIISQTKIPPTKFESLNKFMTKKTNPKPFERSIDEHNLIDCKDNDFGLECSCSITLSPPRCKKLINSFLSSCRILGCQNNGRCINITANFPIPYVCSCPSEYMGTYCEIERPLKSLRKATPQPPSTLLAKSKFSKTPTSRTSSKLIMPKNFYHIENQLCEPNPCLNNAVCKVHTNHHNITFECICPNPFFHGKYCEKFSFVRPDTTKPTTTTSTTTTTTTTTTKTTTMPPTTINIRKYKANNFNDCPSDCNSEFEQGYCTFSSKFALAPKCICHKGWTGKDCSDRDYCISHGCLNNSTCLNYPEMQSYLCKCSKGFSGRSCELVNPMFVTTKKSVTKAIKNICLAERCQNGGQCVMLFSNSGTQFTFECKCPKNYYGQLCEFKKNQFGRLIDSSTKTFGLKKIPFKSDFRCLNGGFRIEHFKNRCLCTRDYTGQFCEVEICPDMYKSISNHTMCANDSPSLISGDINQSDKEFILITHNALRSKVVPKAANMQKIYWDKTLQKLAQKRAQLCSLKKIPILKRQEPGYGVLIGENLAAGYQSWPQVLAIWMNESSNGSSLENKANHYTQMIYSSASKIGCGYAKCANSYVSHFVCYYGEMQEYSGEKIQPYKKGESCNDCPNNCNKGLCDCKGAYCLNGGQMNLRTCTCSCPYSSFSGRYCEKMACPKKDSPMCSKPMFNQKCWLYPVVRASCPYMCNICSKNRITANFF